jgi:hypothetical protein
MITFEESGMTFSFDDGRCFRIEQDPLMKSPCKGSTNNNMSCECVAVCQDTVCFIEAKKSAPLSVRGELKCRPEGWRVYDNLQVYWRDITKKFVDSFSALKALLEGHHGNARKSQVGLPVKALDFDKLKFVLILNLPGGIDKARFPGHQDKLKQEMRPFLNTWNIPDTSVKVVSPSLARKMGVDVEISG